MIYGCSQPRELWFIDFNHVDTVYMHVHQMKYRFVLQVTRAVHIHLHALGDFHLHLGLCDIWLFTAKEVVVMYIHRMKL